MRSGRHGAGDGDDEESGTTMKNLGQMMKQAQKLQERMGELQEQLASPSSPARLVAAWCR